MSDTIYRREAIDALMAAVDDVGVLDGDDIKVVFDNLPSAQPEADEVARDMATIIENEKDMRVIRENAEQKWIPCKEMLPKEYGRYLATMDDGDVQECSYSPEKDKPFLRGGWSTCDADGITFLDIAEVIAWRPLPDPYEGE